MPSPNIMADYTNLNNDSTLDFRIRQMLRKALAQYIKCRLKFLLLIIQGTSIIYLRKECHTKDVNIEDVIVEVQGPGWKS